MCVPHIEFWNILLPHVYTIICGFNKLYEFRSCNFADSWQKLVPLNMRHSHISAFDLLVFVP